MHKGSGVWMGGVWPVHLGHWRRAENETDAVHLRRLLRLGDQRPGDHSEPYRAKEGFPVHARRLLTHGADGIVLTASLLVGAVINRPNPIVVSSNVRSGQMPRSYGCRLAGVN